MEFEYFYSNTMKQMNLNYNDSVNDAEIQFLRVIKNNFYRYYVEVGDGCKIWTLSSVPYPSLTDNSKSDKPPIILIHGFLAGLAFWAMNIDDIIEAGNVLYAIDLPGFGRSTRNEFSKDVFETENIFVDNIEKWRMKLGINKMIIVGHSFGGYLTVIYALKYPQYIKNIILVDPWGFPDVKEDVAAQIEYVGSDTLSTPAMNLPIWVKILMMFNTPFTPFAFLRLSGNYLGPKIIHYLRPEMTHRFSCAFGDTDIYTVPNYLYNINKSHPSGEKAFKTITGPFVWAKNPLIKRISSINKKIQISFIYGSESWIDFQTGYEVQNMLKEHKVNVYVIEKAGHHIFADQPKLFNNIIREIVKGNSSSIIHRKELQITSPCLIVKDMPKKSL